jgi:multidrug efflux system membrane fusion protein
MTTKTKPPEALPEVYLPGPHEPTRPSSTKPKKRGLIWVVFLLIVAGVAGYAVWSAGHPTGPPRPSNNGGGGGGRGGGRRAAAIGPVPVVVSTVTRSSIPVYLNGLGNVVAYYTVTVKSRVDGQLMKVDFNEGDLVTEGQVLCEIDQRPYQVQLDLAVGQLARDQAQLGQAQANLERDTAQQKYAQTEAERYARLVEQGIIARDQGEQLKSNADSLNGTLTADRAAIQSARAQIEADQATIANAKLQLTYSKITAPITGIVGLRLVDPGNIVHAADANGMVVITQLQPITVQFTIPEDSLPQVTQKLRAGAHLTVEAYSRDNSKKLASGKLVTLDNQIDSTTGTSKLKAVFDNTDNALFPQQFVNIRLLVDTLEGQLVVPNVAVQNGQQGTFVYVVDQDSRVHLKPVQVGITTETSADILGGISDGERVVVDGADRLIEASEVRVRKAGELDNPPDFDPAAAGNGRSKRGDGKFKKGDGSFKKGRGGDSNQ